jgi:glycerol-3-phosphate O-acyltransferase/dihydroxyacetone phosphate acyltransferase
VFYFLLKPIVRIFYRIYYRIQVRGLENFLKENPLVIIPNHVNGFIDPVVTALFAKRKIRFFARGDVFRGRLARWLLNDLNISPMYRITEGYGDVKKNDQTFEECRRLLTENKAILIFPEGICIQDRRIKKLKKGLARIVLSVEEEMLNKNDVQVVPVGLNYSNPSHFRSRLFINIGHPVSLGQFHTRYCQDKVKAINECTQFMEEEMKKLVINIDDPGNDRLYEAVAEIYTRQSLEEKGLDSANLETEYEKNNTLADRINALHKSTPGQIKQLNDKILPYLKELKQHGLRDHLLRRDVLSKMNLKSAMRDFFKLWFGLPVYWIGLLLNSPPYKLARNMADTKAKMKEFYSSVFANLSMLLWLPYYLLQLAAIHHFSHSWWIVLVWAILVPVTGFFVIGFHPVMKKAFGRWKLLGLVRKNKASAERLIYEREEIIQLIRQYLDETRE